MSSSIKSVTHKRLLSKLFPFLGWLQITNAQTIKLDFFAAITSAIFALPQGLAFALIAGLPPEIGLYSAMIAPVVSAFFGSSWHNVSGPTVSTSVVVLSIISMYAIPNSPQYIGFVFILTLLAGLIQLLLGIFRLGHIVSFISHTVILGFSSGAAALIMISQVKDFLGINIERQESITSQAKEIFNHIHELQPNVVIISVITLLSAIICARFFKKLPYLLIAMIFGSIAALIMHSFFHVTNIHMVPSLPKGLPDFTLPHLTANNTRQLFSSAIAIATLGLIQSVSISRTIAAKSGQEINPNQEFIGQGLTNIVCSFFSGFFSSSSFTRTGVNYTAGAKTPLSSIFASIIIMICLIFGSNLTGYLPIPAMSAIIMLVGYKLIDIKHIKKIFKTSKSESAVYIITLLSTLLLSLEFAIYSGVILSLIIYLQKTSHPKVTRLIVNKFDPYHRLIEVKTDKQSECPQLTIIRIEGPLFFGAVDHIHQKIRHIKAAHTKYLLLVCDGVTLIDISGAEMLVKIKQILKKRGGDLVLSNLNSEAHSFLVNSPYWEQLGASKNIYNFSAEAISSITNELNKSICESCDDRIFSSCDQIQKTKEPKKKIEQL